MSKTISYKGQLDVGVQDRIRLKTNTGKTGYKITKFEIMPSSPMKSSAGDTSLVMKIYSKDQTGATTDTVDFTESDLLAVAIYEGSASHNPETQYIIFDNAMFNQDIFIYLMDPDSGTQPGNYYIELEAITLTDLEATMLTLQSIRNLTAPTGNV